MRLAAIRAFQNDDNNEEAAQDRKRETGAPQGAVTQEADLYLQTGVDMQEQWR